jgi:hypothetical protein
MMTGRTGQGTKRCYYTSNDVQDSIETYFNRQRRHVVRRYQLSHLFTDSLLSFEPAVLYEV